MKQGGYILISRGLLSHLRFKPQGPFSNLEAWLWMINAAAFKPRVIEIRSGRTRKTIQLQRGQFTHSVRFLAAAWSWSPNRVRRFLSDTETDTAIHTQTDTGQMVISLVNYETYQDPHNSSDTQTDTQSYTETDTNKKEGIRKKDIKRSRAAASDEDFAAWYAIYPRKTQANAALKAYRKVITGREISHDDLMARTVAFAAQWASRLAKTPGDKQFIPYPASWLNKGAYDDTSVPDAPKSSTPAPTKAAADFNEADWRDCLTFQTKHGQWSHSEWGPPPGRPGCLVPPHLLLNKVSVSAGVA